MTRPQPLPGLDNPTLLASLRAAITRTRYLDEPGPRYDGDELVRACNRRWLERLQVEATRRGLSLDPAPVVATTP